MIEAKDVRDPLTAENASESKEGNGEGEGGVNNDGQIRGDGEEGRVMSGPPRVVSRLEALDGDLRLATRAAIGGGTAAALSVLTRRAVTHEDLKEQYRAVPLRLAR